MRPVSRDGMCTPCWNLASLNGTPDPVDPLGKVEQEARDQLIRAGVIVKQIIRVEDDCILYRNGAGRAMTAWKWRVNGRLQITWEPGFPLEPDPEMVPRPLRATA